MRKTKRVMLLAFVFMISMMSCNNEELFVEPVQEAVVDDQEEEVPEDEVENEAEVDASLPCDFNFDTIEPNSTIILNCVMDLGGNTINIPEGVTFLYEGGDIINGTLNFSGNTTISGELLNSTLTFSGSTPQLKDTTFNLDSTRWGIVEGIVNYDVAYNNKLIINQILQNVKDLGVTIIKIDKLDAYFGVKPIASLKERTQDAAIQIPSDIHLIMTDNTHLRTQPNDYKNSTLIIVFQTDNTIIEGGFLHGDRDTHDYTDTSSSHEWGHLIALRGSKNTIVKNVTLMDAGGDAISIHAFGHSYDSYYRFCENILITNNRMVRNRRAGMSITDGRDLIIENNAFIDCGVSTKLSKGTAPGWAINFEPIEQNGIIYEIVQGVIVRNNTETGSEKGGIVIARADYITIEDNNFESTVAMGETVGSIVRNNVFENPTESALVAIYAGMNDPRGHGNERSHDNQVYGNSIIGFDKGIFLQDPGMDLHDNTMTNCGSGIMIKNNRQSKIRNNTIISNVDKSEGIGTHYPKYVDNLIISNNIIEVKGSPFRLTQVNLGEDQSNFKITIQDNEVTSLENSSSYIQLTRNFDFKNNLCHNSGIRTIEASTGNIVNNTFDNGVIRISKGCVDLNFTGNTITGGKCFYDDNSDAVNISKENNICD